METSNTIHNKSLSIRIATDGLSFCVYAPGEAQPYTYKEYEVRPVISMAANLKAALLNEPMLQEEYQRVNVLIAQPLYTTVPVVDFDRDTVADTFHFVFPKTTASHVSYNVLRRSGIAIIFGLDKNIYQLLLDDFPRARFYASASTLIEFFSEKSLIGTGRKMFVFCHDSDMNLYCFDQGRMIFVNTFRVHGIDDCQYFILNVWKQLELDQLDDAIAVVDDGPLSQQLTEKIKYFIRNASLVDGFDEQLLARRNTSSNTPAKVISTPTHIPYDLQTLLVCGF